MMLRFLYLFLAFASFGFYVHPLCAYENPAHPRDVQDIAEEDEANHPANEYERKALDEIDPDGAPHSEEDRKNFAHIDTS